MKLLVDGNKLKESMELGAYDENGLSKSKSGLYKYPSKMMFIRFLTPFLNNEFKPLKGTCDIWSVDDWGKDEVTIHVEIKYRVPNLPKEQPEEKSEK